MLFSVIIPTYNRATLLREALDSVFAQKFTDYEVIVVDDGSTDETSQVLATYRDRIRIVLQENKGPGAARNLGARQARGDYIAFLDSDDVWFPWSLETYTAVIRRFDGPAFVAGSPYRFARTESLAAVAAEVADCNAFSDYIASGDEWRWWGVSSFVVRREAFQAVGGFTNDWINGEDADLAMRLGEATGFVQICAPVTFGYREHPASAMKNFNRTLAGVRHKIQTEKECKYPGGPQRAYQRRRILTRHVRPVSLDCLRKGMPREGWELYRTTFAWHVRLARWKYLAAFPLKAVLAHL